MAPPSVDMASSPPPEESIEIQDHPDWQSGDFTLISSDGWRFKAPSYSLFHASAVLRDAPAGGPLEITFTDESIETKEVLEQFLSLVVHSRLVPRKEDDELWKTVCNLIPGQTLDIFLDLISFLHKYDCAPTLRSFCGEVLKFVSFEAISPLDGFALGAIAADDDLCAASLAMVDFSSEGEGLKLGDIGAFVWERAGPRYLYALTKTKQSFEVDEDEDPVARTFYYYLDRAASKEKSFIG